jgi:hypothetical protein
MSFHVCDSYVPAQDRGRQAIWIAWRLPVIMMILSATAIPVELRPRGINALGYGFEVADVAANILGYVPLGIVLGNNGFIRAVLIAGGMSTLAEASQFVMAFRDPSLVDVGSNIVGAALGALLSAAWRISDLELEITRLRTVTAVLLAASLMLGVWASAGDALNPRGVAVPGILEAHWTLDEVDGRIARDSSGRGLNGFFSNRPKQIRGANGGAIMFDGGRDYIRVSHSTAFRITGSMTISAWIYSTSYPVDDAAIVSNLGAPDLGYQLDTTIDSGPRTVGFKLSNTCQQSMARYGATPLHLNTWYYVAGVYDAHAQTMDVYLDGALDDGALFGKVGRSQRSSREPLCIGKRSDLTGYEFAGAISDVRLYSRALTPSEIIADMGREAPGQHPSRRTREVSPLRVVGNGSEPTSLDCTWSSEFEDRKLPLPVALMGMLVAAISIGFASAARPFYWLVGSPLSGLLLFYLASPTLPRHNMWAFPLISLAGAASVGFSVRGAWSKLAD